MSTLGAKQRAQYFSIFSGLFSKNYILFAFGFGFVPQIVKIELKNCAVRTNRCVRNLGPSLGLINRS